MWRKSGGGDIRGGMGNRIAMGEKGGLFRLCSGGKAPHQRSVTGRDVVDRFGEERGGFDLLRRGGKKDATKTVFGVRWGEKLQEKNGRGGGRGIAAGGRVDLASPFQGVL